MLGKYTCGFCGEIYDDMDEYYKCVSGCRDALKAKENKKRLEEINAYINRVKAAKDYYEQVVNEFKTKYPDEYEMNFSGCNCGSECKCHEETKTYVSEDKLPDWAKQANSFEYSYENNGKDEPKVSVRLNGKEVPNPLEKLLSDPNTKHIAELLGL